MKTVQKYFYLLLLSLALLAVAAFVGTKMATIYLQPAAPEQEMPAFLVAGADGSSPERINIYDAGDGNHYVFLPSYAQPDRVNVIAGKGHRFTLGGVDLTDGLSCGRFRLDTPYAFAADGEHLGNLRFLRSENVAAIYIDTVSGNMNKVHRDTFPEEPAGARVYTPEGHVDFSEDYTMIKCRGYSSWGMDKKSYTLDLGRSKNLLNLGASERWTLTANGYDQTHLRNKTVYSFVNALPEGAPLSPECVHTELYLNGEYAGLYLLCQKPDTGPDHLDLPTEDYYFEMMPSTRSPDSSAAFAICASQTAEILFPQNCTAEQRDFLQEYLGAFQEALLSEEGSASGDLPIWSDYIDMESWAKKYLIEEIFANVDGGTASQFFRLSTADGKLYVGHCWDYDLSLGKPEGTSWRSLLIQRSWGAEQSWFGALCQKEEFVDAVTACYEEEFRPLLQTYAGQTIPEFAKEIAGAIPSEYLRWPELYKNTDWESEVEEIITFLQARIDLFDALWLEEAPFCVVTVGDSNFCVPVGTVCTDLPKSDAPGGIWYLAGTDIPFDATQPVTKNLTLSYSPASETAPPVKQPQTEENVQQAAGFTTQDYITMASVAALVLLLLCFGAMDFFQRRKDRRKANDHSRTKISP